MVESAPEIMYGVSGDCRERTGAILNLAYVINQLSRLRLALGPDFVWIGAVEGPNLTLQIRDVLFGPFNTFGHDPHRRV